MFSSDLDAAVFASLAQPQPGGRAPTRRRAPRQKTAKQQRAQALADAAAAPGSSDGKKNRSAHKGGASSAAAAAAAAATEEQQEEGAPAGKEPIPAAVLPLRKGFDQRAQAEAHLAPLPPALVRMLLDVQGAIGDESLSVGRDSDGTTSAAGGGGAFGFGEILALPQLRLPLPARAATPSVLESAARPCSSASTARSTSRRALRSDDVGAGSSAAYAAELGAAAERLEPRSAALLILAHLDRLVTPHLPPLRYTPPHDAGCGGAAEAVR